MRIKRARKLDRISFKVNFHTLNSESVAINLVELEPEIAAEGHGADHAQVGEGEEDTVELLVDDVVHDVVYLGEVNPCRHILLVNLLIPTFHLRLGFCGGFDLSECPVLLNDLSIHRVQIVDQLVHFGHLVLECLKRVLEFHGGCIVDFERH